MDSYPENIYKEFLADCQSTDRKPWVDLNKAHALMKSEHAPRKWRVVFSFLTWLTVATFPSGISAFFVTKWWVGVVTLIFGFMLSVFTQRFGARVLIKVAKKDINFFCLASLTNTIKLAKISNQPPLS